MHRKTILAGAASLLLGVAAALAGDGDAPATPAGSSPAAASAGKVNINQATSAQLALLPRIGEKVAERIVDYRKEHGNFARPDDLMEVKGIGEKLFLTSPYVTVSGPTTVTERFAPALPAALRGAAKPRLHRPGRAGAVTTCPPGAARRPGPSARGGLSSVSSSGCSRFSSRSPPLQAPGSTICARSCRLIGGRESAAPTARRTSPSQGVNVG
jgi:competence protein ComEA